MAGMRRATTRMRGVPLLALAVGVAACAPLTGSSVDPVGPLFASGAGPTRGDLWIGGYEDSRGAGTIQVRATRDGPRLTGIWWLRTGGAGTLAAEASGPGAVRFRLWTDARTCPGSVEGSGVITADVWTGTYAGQDCQGPVTGGRLWLKRQ